MGGARSGGARSVTWHAYFDATYVINLAKRPDRLHRSLAQHQRLGLPSQRFAAVDGESLRAHEIDPRLIALSYDTSENARWDRHVQAGQMRQLSAGEIGCALSHVALWRLMQVRQFERLLILEDDIRFRSDFAAALPVYWRQLPAAWDIVFLGQHAVAECEQLDANLTRPRYQFGAFAYVLSRRGASRLLAALPVRGPLDNFVADQFARLAVFNFSPALVRHAEAWNVGSNIVHSAQL
jgi:GR25 family glycosyltransferase involved in LPS biosynthesis